MSMLLVGLHAIGPDPAHGARVAGLVTSLLPARFPEVVGHATAMTARPRLVEVAVFLHEGVVDPRATLRLCADGLLADLAAEHVLGHARWACHSPRLPGDTAPVW